MMRPVLAVAVVSCETPELTADRLRSVLAHEPFEMVVVDNGSSQTVVEALRAIDGIRLAGTGVSGGVTAAVNRCLAKTERSRTS